MSKVVMFSHRPIFDKGLTSGPGIRVYEIAKALRRKGHTVVIAEKKSQKKQVKEKIILTPWNKKFESKINEDFNVAIVNTWCNDYEFLDRINIPLIADISTPLLIESEIYFSHTYKEITSHQEKHYINDTLIPLMNLLEKSDMFICANERQKWYYYGILQYLGRLGPYNKGEDIIKIVPFGVSKGKKGKKGFLKKRNELKNKKIILWPGGIFPWFDAETPIKAVAKIAKTKPDVVLVFIGANNPLVPSALIYKNLKKAEKTAKELGVLNKNVFFHDWVKIEHKNDVYADTDIVVITHKKNLETYFSFRTRTIDALGAEMAVICTEGDTISDFITKEKAGLIVKAENSNDLEKKILYLLENHDLRKKIKNNTNKIIKEFSWDIITNELSEFCKNPIKKYDNMTFSPYILLKQQNQQIIKQDEQIRNKEEQIKQEQEQIREIFKIINNQKSIIKEQADIICKFKGSIVFPFYKLTSRTGKTKVGIIVSRILK